MYGYKVLLNEDVVSSNRGYDTEDEAKAYAESDAKYFADKENVSIEVFEE